MHHSYSNYLSNCNVCIFLLMLILMLTNLQNHALVRALTSLSQDRGCANNQFRCKETAKCIPLTLLCDGKVDCRNSSVNDDSDEDNPRCKVFNICPKNFFSCKDNVTCIPLVHVCDETVDCPDGSDEESYCVDKSHKTLCPITKKCQYGCKPIPDGATCYCPVNKFYDEKEKNCVDANECLIEGSCDQKCSNTNGSFTCSCVEGYELIDRRRCKALKQNKTGFVDEPILLLLSRNAIRRLYLNETVIRQLNYASQMRISAFDFDYKQQRVYWISRNLKTDIADFNYGNITNLYKNNGNLSMSQVFLAKANIEIDMMKRDWITGNFYFSSSLAPFTLILCRSNLKVCVRLFNGQKKDLGNPHDMVIDPTVGFIFISFPYSETPFIGRTHLDGSELYKLPSETVLKPYLVTLDLVNKEVFWTDIELSIIAYTDYNGQKKPYIVMKSDIVSSLIGIISFEQYFYAISADQSLHKINRFNRSDVSLIKKSRQRSSDLIVFHRVLQPSAMSPLKEFNNICGRSNGGCDHICVPIVKINKVAKRCLCSAGFKLVDEGKCIPINERKIMMFIQNGLPSIRSISLALDFQNSDAKNPIVSKYKPKLFDYDPFGKFVYYYGVEKDESLIIRQRMNGSQEVLLKQGLSTTTGFAVDWMANNFYVLNQEAGSIAAIRISNVNKRKTVLLPNVLKRENLLVDPKIGKLFWVETRFLSSKVHSTIMTMDMDLTNSSEFFPKSSAFNVSCISLYKKDLYWFDTNRRYFERSGVDGGEVNSLYQAGIHENPTSFAIDGSSLFYINSVTNEIKMVILGTNPVFISHTLVVGGLLNLKIFHTVVQTDVLASNPCGEFNGGCSDLCLLYPSKDKVDKICGCSDDSDVALCTCRSGFSLNNDNRTCVNDSLVPKKDTNTCNLNFQCIDGNGCVGAEYLCDGDFDCSDGSDEDGSNEGVCSNITCPENAFQCGSTRLCIPQNWVCDGDPDCPNAEDEIPEFCSTIPCHENQLRCKVSQRCIPVSWTCDGNLDCGADDYSDEDNNCIPSICGFHEFKCHDGPCIDISSHCNGISDCDDESDEKDCSVIRCNGTTQFQCLSGSQCLHKSYHCNGIAECDDGSDEINCSKAALSRLTCHDDEFACNDGRCIPLSFRCDLNKDCADGSDEINCASISCSSFLCQDRKKCIPLFWQCDGHNDCDDNSDEIDCEPKFKCDYPNLTCDSATKCIEVSKICDKRQDCADGTDEGDGCSTFSCFNSDCDGYCQSTPDGHLCYCPQNQTLSSDQKTCLEEHPCDLWGTCSQKCRQFQFVHKCECFPGYALEPDHFTCKSIDSASPYIIYSNRHELRSVGINKMSTKSLLPGLKNTIALDFYHSNEGDQIFWTDIVDDKIYRASMVNRSIRNIEVIQNGLASAEGLAVDWIGMNLYWVESSLDQIEVAKLNGSFRKTLIAGNMKSPRAIALDPRYGVLFWSDWDASAPRIERASMSGDERKIVFKVDSVTEGAWPNGLTLDFVTHRIYWIDAKSDSIHTTKYDGSDHREIMKGHSLMTHPFAITLYENYIYWTDWRTNAVSRANKWNGTNVEIVEKAISQPFDIKVVHPSRQPRDVLNPCGNNNGGCSHLCLLSFNSTYQCHCPHVMKLDKDNKTCLKDELVLLFSRPNEIRGIDIELPYYYIIPPLGQPQVATPSQIDFNSKTKEIFWADTQQNKIKKSSLTGVLIETVLDTVTENPFGFAIDWASQNMFFSSFQDNLGSIFVSNLNGEYLKSIIQRENLKPMSLSVHPFKGKVIFADHSEFKNYTIIMANMDGENEIILTSSDSNPALKLPTSLCIDFSSNYLYWVNLDKDVSIQRINLDGHPLVEKVELSSEIALGISAITVYLNKLIFSAKYDILYIADKNNPKEYKVLRNNTQEIISLKMYDENLQSEENVCSFNKGGCSHLCLPTSETDKICACSIGYHVDPSNSSQCLGSDKFLLYSINWEIHGLSIDPAENSTKVLAPISHVVMATALDYHAETEFIYWVDNDAGSINRIKRDGTSRETVISGLDSIEGIAIDWVAGNLYWANSVYDTIEIARLNGSCHYVLISGDMDRPKAITVSPASGYLFWSDWGMPPKIERTTLDGKNRMVLVNSSIMFVVDVAVDESENRLYWCDQRADRIERIKFDGSGREIVVDFSEQSGLGPSIENPLALTIYGDYIYYTDSTYQLGSINRVNKKNVSDFLTMKQIQGAPVKDIIVVHHDHQKSLNPCSVNNGNCQELCLYRGNGSVICACAHGRIAPDGRSCEDYDAFLIYSKVLKISSIHLTEDDNLNSPFPDIIDRKFMRNVIGLAFDFKSRRIFYSDIQLGTINSVFFNGSKHIVLVENKQNLIEGLAFDPVYSELYWTSNGDASINRIGMNTDILHPRAIKLIKLASNDKPRGIAVDGCKSFIFWTNWNTQQPSIQRSSLTGYNIKSIISTDISMPNAITIDHLAQKLYWSDARLDKIERCNMDGNNRYVLLRNHPQHPFDITVFDQYIFWTDWVRHAVLRANKYTGEDVKVLRRNITRIMGITAVANITQDCKINPCFTSKLNCEDLCDVHLNGTAYCACIKGRKLLPDGKQCVVDENGCSENEFQCRSGVCIPYQYTCDGIFECPDKADEDPDYCKARTCKTGFFQCANNRCVPESQVCDHSNNCGDYSDEVNCTCMPNQFECKSKLCIDQKYRCNRDVDCPDASDEMGCDPMDCVHPNTAEELKLLIPCNTTTACILKEWICDGQNDCWDNSDEQNCTKTPSPTCPSNFFRCRNGQCIPVAWRCDREQDCLDSFESDDDKISSDEENCTYVCNKDQFQCHNGYCIPISNKCDGKEDCLDGSDESDDCKKTDCLPGEMKCNSTGHCINQAWICDGDNDCGGLVAEDEHPDQGCVGSFCDPGEFQCANLQCIVKTFYCDRENDCGDNSDEPDTCVYHDCTEDEFKCTNLKCIPKSWVCNGLSDCTDHSDESNCFKNVSECSSNQFQCKNMVCVSNDLLCNGQNDCGDFSDEDGCDVNECETDVAYCGQICKDKPIGFECACRSGFRLIDDHLCDDIDECAEVHPCSQFCRNSYGNYSCHCAKGYISVDGGQNCKADTPIKPSIIFSNRYYIREISTTGASETILHAQNLTYAVALDFDWEENCLYWSEITTLGSSIRRMCENITGHQVIHDSTVRQPDGLAVDWIGRNLYWCDKGRRTIEASKLDGRYRKVLLSDGLDKPRAIVLDPHEGYMYWTDWGDKAFIGKAQMDGQKPRHIINDSLGWPNALTIDYVTRELFWADARRDYIAVTDLEGNNKRIITDRDSSSVHHIFSIAVFESYLYWTDWETKNVEKCQKYDGKNHETIVKTVHQPMNLVVRHPYRQQKLNSRNPCENNGGCSTLCLLSPGLKRTCLCPENFILSSDGKSCTPNCTSSQTACKSTYKCIPFWWNCDSQDDCGDGSDEPSTCKPFICIPGQFQCSDGTSCTHPSQICDGIKQCNDGSDERNCSNHTCLPSQYKCTGSENIASRCIPLSHKCNGYPDCPDKDDELNCAPKTCEPHRMQCNNSLCIPNLFVCDGDDDCGDGSDEPPSCATRTCGEDEFRCNSGRCIPSAWYCDGGLDCSEWEDEPHSCSENTCDPTYFACNNSRCIPGRWHCDLDNDCGDNSDEENCVPRNCSESEFRCTNGRCIHGSLRCNGEYSCEDLSDEMDCHQTCPSNKFQCHDPPVCIDKIWRCDNNADCADGSDEEGCGETCSSGDFQCKSGECIPSFWLCDGQNDCDDGSDEEHQLCKSRGCEPGRSFCRNHKCVPVAQFCDGIDNCGDNSDEDPEFCGKEKVSCESNGLFRCKEGHCISQKYVCNKFDDCGDYSDEENCDKCKFRSCSQLCFAKNSEQFTCGCAEGYKPDWSKSGCSAKGDPAVLMVASHSGLRQFNPYKPQHETSEDILGKIIESTTGFSCLDVMYTPDYNIIFWADKNKKAILRSSFTNPNFKKSDDVKQKLLRVRRQEQTYVIIGNLSYPRGISVDWVGKHIYWTDSGHQSVSVATIDGTWIKTLIKSNLEIPSDIVVNPRLGQIFWTDLGSSPKIETVQMDGSNRKTLVSSKLVWPSGLAIDYPSGHLYWADSKLAVVEKIDLDGTNRVIVRSFVNDEFKPFKIEVFEDYLYLTSFKNSIMKIHKFGDKEPVFNIKGLNKVSDLVIVQKSKQIANISDPCWRQRSMCHGLMECLQHSATEAVCLCPDGYIDKLGNDSQVHCVKVKDHNAREKCSKICYNGGTCQFDSNQQPQCRCLPDYTGNQCNIYRCSNYCENHGFCYSESDENNLDGSPKLKCRCPSQFTGERCEIPSHLCDNYCQNRGLCHILYGVPHCICIKDFTGKRCEVCKNLKCENNAPCKVENDGSLRCVCPVGYTGKLCEKSTCDDYCSNNSFCELDVNGIPSCKCHPGYGGSRCDHDLCKGFCLNGGICVGRNDDVSCQCSKNFIGRRCEKKITGENECKCLNGGECMTIQKDHSYQKGVITFCNCQPGYVGEYCQELKASKCEEIDCRNGGICEMVHRIPTCRCPDGYAGSRCESTSSSSCNGYCLHGGSCVYTGSPDFAPFCTCLPGWSGLRCDIRTSCKAFCYNGGTCSPPLEQDEMPTCRCQQGFYGLRCEGSSLYQESESKLNYTDVIIGVVVVVIVLIIIVVLIVFYKRKKRTPFMHIRMQDNSNVEISNPMYLREDYEDGADGEDVTFNMNMDKLTNVQNPLYNTLFEDDATGMPGGNEEKKGLLQHDDLKGETSASKNDILT